MRCPRWIPIVASIGLATFVAARASSRFDAAPVRFGQRGTAEIPATAQGTIQGTVRRPDTSEPISDVAVSLSSAFGTSLSVTTDSSGRFAFRNLPVGGYAVEAERQGYSPAGTGATGPRGNPLAVFRQAVALTIQQPTATLTIEMLPAGSISGRVVNQTSQPVAGIQVQALVKSYQPARGLLTPVGGNAQILTDDRGEFRLWGLAPGEYFLRAVPQGGARRGATVASYATTYHPSAQDFATALPLKVAAGNDQIVELRLLPLKSIPLTVQVTSTDPNAQVNTPQLSLVPKDWRAADPTEVQGRLTRGAAGAIQIQVPRAGSYDVVAVAQAADAPARATFDGLGPAPVLFVGVTRVDVRENSSETVTISVVRTMNLEVRLNTNGNLVPNGELPRQLELVRKDTSLVSALMPREAGERGGRGSGTLRSFAPVIRGQYVLESPLATLGTGYIADIRQGGKSILEDGIITVDRDPVDPVEIVIAPSGGIIQGTVRDEQGRPLANGQVILIPEGTRRLNPLLYRRSTLVQSVSGVFNISGITPGLYKAFAFETLPAGAERSAEFMQPFETFGRSVNVTPGTTISGLSLPLIRR